MDILISSNLERLIHLIADEDAKKTRAFMEQLKTGGSYEITAEMKEKLADFRAGYASEEDTAAAIRAVYEKTGYVMDPHTAVASHVCRSLKEESGSSRKCVIASTASPFIFFKSVMDALGKGEEETDELELLPKLENISSVSMPGAVREILHARVLHTTECDADRMEDAVKKILKL